MHDRLRAIGHLLRRHAAPVDTAEESPVDFADRPWLTADDVESLVALRGKCALPSGVNLAVVKAARADRAHHRGFLEELDALLNRELPSDDTVEELTMRAVHEAGHAVVGIGVGLSVMHVDLTVRDESGGQTATFVHDDTPDTMWAGVVSAMGGAAGEIAMFGTANAIGASADVEGVLTRAVVLQAVGWTNESSADLISRAIRDAKRIVEANREILARVTQALLDVGALDALDVLRLTEGLVTLSDMDAPSERILRAA